MPERTVILASPRGFCAGVQHAVEIAETVLRQLPPPLYALNELVHNRQVVESFARRGVQFVRSIDAVPAGATVLFSAHGVPPATRAAAAARGIRVIDATCPFVVKVHHEVRRFAAEGLAIALIGHRGHDEVVGVAGEAPGQVTVIESAGEAEAFQPGEAPGVAVVTQTTLSAAEAERVLAVLRRRFPALRMSAAEDICYATTNRQQAVRALAARTRLILVLGGRHSSNTLRLAEVARAAGAEALLVSARDELPVDRLKPLAEVGLTAGASTPEAFIEEVLASLAADGFTRRETLETVREAIRFPLPRDLAGM
jgi:4-hydroxy-3-methylbut-2-enyl diphosphate reductase